MGSRGWSTFGQQSPENTSLFTAFSFRLSVIPNWRYRLEINCIFELLEIIGFYCILMAERVRFPCTSATNFHKRGYLESSSGRG